MRGIGVETPSPKSFWGGLGDDREYNYMCITCIYTFTHTRGHLLSCSLYVSASLSHTHILIQMFADALHGTHPKKEPSRFAHTHTHTRTRTKTYLRTLSHSLSLSLSHTHTHVHTHTFADPLHVAQSQERTKSICSMYQCLFCNRNTLQRSVSHTAPHCSTRDATATSQHTATPVIQHAATHTATHSFTLQHATRHGHVSRVIYKSRIISHTYYWSRNTYL